METFAEVSNWFNTLVLQPMGVSSSENGGIPKNGWFLWTGQSQSKIWMMTGCTPILGNLHIHVGEYLIPPAWSRVKIFSPPLQEIRDPTGVRKNHYWDIDVSAKDGCLHHRIVHCWSWCFPVKKNNTMYKYVCMYVYIGMYIYIYV